VIDRAPEIDHLAVELHIHHVEVPSPVSKPAHFRPVVSPPYPAYLTTGAFALTVPFDVIRISQSQGHRD
jgi:hypothetical protein